MAVTGDGVLAMTGIGMGEGVESGARVPAEVGASTGGPDGSGAGAGVPDGIGQGLQVEQSPQLRQTWARPKSDEWSDGPRKGMGDKKRAGGNEVGKRQMRPMVRFRARGWMEWQSNGGCLSNGRLKLQNFTAPPVGKIGEKIEKM